MIIIDMSSKFTKNLLVYFILKNSTGIGFFFQRREINSASILLTNKRIVFKHVYMLFYDIL